MKPAVLLFSGGLDSTTLLAHATREGYDVHALTFRYGQRHVVEVEVARRIAAEYRVHRHLIVDLDLRAIGGSALTADIDVPKHRDVDESAKIPMTYVPARNTIFLSYALAWADVIPSANIFIGVNALDFSGYPDCRPEFIAAYERMANLATRGGVEGPDPIRIHTPLIGMNKAEIVRMGATLSVDFAGTTSCYDPTLDGGACGSCDACQLRRRGFVAAGVADPTRYVGHS